ncbi:MAG: universal stress protein [Candidatus Sericytochromatia bacterium]|nr:universal stress protein [Candidatus Sericytochromatia bacterium]
MYRRILAAVDDSEPAEAALGVAVELARSLHAGLTVIHVVETPSGAGITSGVPVLKEIDLRRERGTVFLQRVGMRLPAELQPTLLLRVGPPAEQILAAAEECEADLIVLGTHGRMGLHRLALGSTADAVTRRSRHPVVTVRSAWNETAVA